MTGDVLRKKYIMLTNLTSYVHKGAADFFVLRDVRSYVFGRWWGRGRRGERAHRPLRVMMARDVGNNPDDHK